MNKTVGFLVTAGAIAATTTAASAHVAVASGPAQAGQNAIVTFSVGHGCEGADTYLLDVTIPKQITSVRGMPNFFGPADVQVDAAGLPKNVVWMKDEVRDADDQYYQLSVRVRVPDAPFTTLYFKVLQGCRDKDGMEYSTDWAALPTGDEHGHGEGDPPAAQLVILPPHSPGWNKFTVPSKLHDLEMFFGDAQIVWYGDAAYSANPTTAELIDAEEGVEPLTELPKNAEIWVKY